MRAIRYYGPFDVRLEHDVPEPECLAHQIKIRPSFCGICGSDVHAFDSPSALPFKDTPHPVTGETWPVTLGHEFAGDVVEVGTGVHNGLRVGDRVAVQPSICCQKCPACQEGLVNCCSSFGFVGLMGWGGGLSDFVCVDAKFAFRLPETVSSEIGALVEPLAVAWHAVERSGFTPGGTALVMGAGPIGLAVIQCLRARRAGKIISAEVSPDRRDLASDFGAGLVVDPSTHDTVRICQEACGQGRGPDVAFDCAGVAASIKAACDAVRYRGSVVSMAVWSRDVPFNFDSLLVGEKKMISSLSYTSSDFESVIKELGNGGLQDVGRMITSRIAMDRLVEDGLVALTNGKSNQVKVLVDTRKYLQDTSM